MSVNNERTRDSLPKRGLDSAWFLDVQKREKRIKSNVLVAEGFVSLWAAILGVIVGWLVGRIIGAIAVAVVFLVVSNILIIRFVNSSGTKLALDLFGSKMMLLKDAEVMGISKEKIERVFNIIERLCIQDGISDCEIYVIDFPSVNSLAIEDKKGRAFILTKGAVNTLDRMKMEALLGHEIGVLRSQVGHLGGVEMAMFKLSSFFPPLRKLQGSFNDPLAPISADLYAIGLTRYPPALIDLLSGDSSDHSELPQIEPFRKLWLFPLQNEGTMAVEQMVSIDERVEILSDF
ncbi:MAG: hypothetical protein HKL80_12140 [Acidimicrobiales bacterium]|nr:hypothetical protein [Acidimicrobiales bacterium]